MLQQRGKLTRLCMDVVIVDNAAAGGLGIIRKIFVALQWFAIMLQFVGNTDNHRL